MSKKKAIIFFMTLAIVLGVGAWFYNNAKQEQREKDKIEAYKNEITMALNSFHEKTDKTDILKIFISTVLMTAVMILVNVTAFSGTELGFASGIIIGIVCGGIGVLVYGVACLALKENILFSLVKGAKNK